MLLKCSNDLHSQLFCIVSFTEVWKYWHLKYRYKIQPVSREAMYIAYMIRGKKNEDNERAGSAMAENNVI